MEGTLSKVRRLRSLMAKGSEGRAPRRKNRRAWGQNGERGVSSLHGKGNRPRVQAPHRCRNGNRRLRVKTAEFEMKLKGRA